MKNSIISLKNIHPYKVGKLIRLGHNNDGGYVIPEVALCHSHILFGIGINDDWSFEEDFVQHVPRARVVGVDGTAGLALLIRRSIIKLFQSIGSILTLNFLKTQERLTYPTKIPRFISFFRKQIFLRKMLGAEPGREAVTLEYLFENYAREHYPNNSTFLKMDIEGAEYDVILNSRDLLDNVNCIVMEFHALDKNWSKFEKVVNLLQRKFVVAHVHGNNCAPLISGTEVPEALEITWLNRALSPADLVPSQLSYPVEGLDQPCSRRLPDYTLLFI